MRVLLILSACLISLNMYSQNLVNDYEQQSLNYFSKEILDKEPKYKNIKYFTFSGEITLESSSKHSFCYRLEKRTFTGTSTEKVLIAENKRIKKKINFFQRLFLSKKKLASIEVFQYYPRDDSSVVVVIYVSSKGWDDFYSITLDVNTKKIINFCVEKMED